MRKILFRGKRVNNGEWVYGSYVNQYGAHEIYLPDGVIKSMSNNEFQMLERSLELTKEELESGE